MTDPAPTGDPELDAALAGITGLANPPRPADWVARPPARLLNGYFERLIEEQVIRRRHRWRFSMRWRISDGPRLAQARGRLDAITGSAGPVDIEQAAYAALVHAAGLDRRLYRGRAHRAERQRLRQIADGRWVASSGWAPAGPVTAETPGCAVGSGPADAALQTMVQAAAHAAVEAATHLTRYAIWSSAATG